MSFWCYEKFVSYNGCYRVNDNVRRQTYVGRQTLKSVIVHKSQGIKLLKCLTSSNVEFYVKIGYGVILKYIPSAIISPFQLSFLYRSSSVFSLFSCSNEVLYWVVYLCENKFCHVFSLKKANVQTSVTNNVFFFLSCTYFSGNLGATLLLYYFLH